QPSACSSWALRPKTNNRTSPPGRLSGVSSGNACDLQAPIGVWHERGGNSAERSMAGPLGNVIDGVLDATVGVLPRTRRLLNQARARRDLRRQLDGLIPVPRIRLDYSAELTCGYDGIIRRAANGYHITTSRRTSRTN